MDSCARCGRHLDEDRVCPECDDTQAAGTPPPAPEAEERYYRAKPFPQAPPPHVVAPTPDPVTEELPVAAGPEESPADDATPDEPPSHEDGSEDATAEHEESDDGEPHPRRRLLILAACLGAVLLGAVVYGFAGPGLPWGGSTVSEKHETPPTEAATDAATSSPSPSDASPSSDAPSASPPEKPTATPSPSGPPQAEPPAPATTAGRAPTQPPAPKPTRSSTPTAPPSDHPSPSPSQSCFLIFCR